MFWNKIKAHTPEIFLLGSVAILQFFRLGIGEIQPWDESLYLVRVEAIQKFGGWLDQTQYAIGGLYSSTHPPLAIWMMTLMRMTFGNSVFVSRMIAAIAGVFAIFFFYRLACRFFSRWTSLLSAVILGSAQLFVWYSHHAQLDIPMFAFIIAAAYYAVLAFEVGGRSKYLIIAGVLFGCALSTKAVQGLYLLPFIISLPYIYQSEKPFQKLTIFFSITFLIAAPWYIYMLIQHPDFYNDYSGLVGAIKTGSYAKELTSQWWYYLNQLIINFPFLILGVMAIPPIIRKWKMQNTPRIRMSLIVVIWFSGMVIFMSSFHTRFSHFALFLFLPAALLVCFFIEEVCTSLNKNRSLAISILLLLPILAWSGSELIRKAIKEHTIISLHNILIPVAAILIVVLIASVIFYKYYSSSKETVLLFASVILLICTDYYRWGSRKNEIYIDGAEQAANIILHSPNIHSLTAYHDGTPHESMLPQLNYYSEGILFGWNPNIINGTKTWGEIDSLIKNDTVPKSDAAIVYVSWSPFYTPTDEENTLLSRINQGLSAKYQNYLDCKKYKLYWDPK